MPGGRPPKGDQQRHPELEELADWFTQAVEGAGYQSLNAVVRADLATRNVVYGISNATRLYAIRQVKAYAVALGRDPAEVEPIWTRAKEAMDRAADAARTAHAPKLTSWSELPLPSLSLKTLLEAQARAVERLPYDMLGVEEPPLSMVYVRQRVRTPRTISPGTAEHHAGEPRDEPNAGADSLRVEARLPVQDALARHEHLLITGEPGAGKSTLTSHLAWTLARIWLRQETSASAPVSEPVVPVRVAAHTLVGEAASWSKTLDRAVRRSMGASLIADPAPWLFQGRVNGARWLILLDGLDEITDYDARKAVVKSIAQYARTSGDYRFVITSRPLPEAELAPLRTATLGEYALDLFGAEELREFADKWFHAQFEDPHPAQAAADRFRKDTDDSRLRELVRNPLLATIAAVSATVSPHRPLPTNRVSLYESFLDRLLIQGTSDDRTGPSALRRRLHDDPDRLALHLWLGRHKRAVLRVLGRHRLETDGPLLVAAANWVRKNAPMSLDGLPGWRDDLPDFLRGTGLLVSEENGFRFLHHSFAEYFAAEAYAADMPTDFPDFESWFWRAAQDDDQTLAVFVLCLWAKREECDPDLLADRLHSGAAGGHHRPLVAGLLLAEGVQFGEQHCHRLIERLTYIARCTWNATAREAAFDALGSLGHIPGVAERLKDIAEQVHLAGADRLLAIRALSRFRPAAVSEELLRDVLGGIHNWLDKAAEVAVTLGPWAMEAVGDRAREVLGHPAESPSVAGAAAEALARLDLAEDVDRLARTALADHTLRSDTVRQLTESWLTTAPHGTTDQVAASIVALILERPAFDMFSYVAAGEVLVKFGEIAAAVQLARKLLASYPVWPKPLDWAAETLIKAQGQEALAEIKDTFAHCSADSGHYPWVASQLSAALAKLDAAEDAVAWARKALGQPGWYLGYADDPAEAWLAAEGPSAAEAVMRATDRGRRVLSHDRSSVAQALFDAGARDEADEIAELALRTPNAYYRENYERAVRIIVKTRGVAAGEDLLEIWRSTPALGVNSHWLWAVTSALPDCKQERDRLLPVLSELGRALVALPSADRPAVMAGLRTLLEVEGTDAVPLAVHTATQQTWLSWDHTRELAAECAALGRRDAAMHLWRHMLEQAEALDGLYFTLLYDMQAADATRDAATWTRELLEKGGLRPARATRFRRLLAWIEAEEQELGT
ncbi:hypothetical protein EJC51_32445 [Streptomyces aquilus]|uniref:NACHT domain-containing protein n=1 Tax=Streptomyces aquilus TaxID=2548456 RepID=A0A3Q9C2V8_9ACTN|nr:hypothetical protein [Streptomyces aquilus]AZP20376.1 hypothetical protein EJC51_32445 [Streptomyces aquilus]